LEQLWHIAAISTVPRRRCDTWLLCVPFLAGSVPANRQCDTHHEALSPRGSWLFASAQMEKPSVANVPFLIPVRNFTQNAKIAKDAKETVQECVSEFIAFITSEASDKCQQEKRKVDPTPVHISFPMQPPSRFIDKPLLNPPTLSSTSRRQLDHQRRRRPVGADHAWVRPLRRAAQGVLSEGCT